MTATWGLFSGVLAVLSGFPAVFGGFLGADGETVETAKGRISGYQGITRDGREYLAWTKIPYAKPPVGELRLAAPEPADGWDGILNATEIPPRCYQVITNAIPAGFSGQEDCLYLNVFRPKIDNKSLPVLVYVHGGAFLMGHSGGVETPEYIMDEDVVLVTIEYRVAALGFMTLNHSAFPGNYGLKDQAMALKWIKENIEAFGGNPNSITVFGVSAGGASAHLLLLSPLTKDIVSRTVAISGVATKIWSQRKVDKVLAGCRAFANRIGCKQADPAEVLNCLREVKDVSVFGDYFGDISKITIPRIPFGPIIEPDEPGAFAPTDLTQTESTKPMIISYTAGEYLLFEIPGRMFGMKTIKNISQDLDGFATRYLKSKVDSEEHLPEAVKKLRSTYLVHSDPEQLNHDIAMIFQDSIFVYPAMTAAEYHKGPKWVYHLDYRGELTFFDAIFKQNTTVPSHADDSFLLFNHRKMYKTAKLQPDPEDMRASKELIKYIVNFAYHDNPAPADSGLPTWKPYEGNEILRIQTGRSEMADSEFIQQQKAIRNLWSEILGTTKWV